MTAEHSTLDLSGLNSELAADLAKAQASVETVGKDGTNTSGKPYSYATAEAMIRGSRKPLGDNGLSFLSTWSVRPVETQPGDIGNQFVGAVVTVHWTLLHKSGGSIRGTAELDAICSRARPTDKAVAATLTYAHGFVLRGLLNIDRDEEDEDAVDRRQETSFAGRVQSRPKQDRRQAAIDASGGALKPATEVERPDWTKPPADVRASDGPHAWYCDAARRLVAQAGCRDAEQARELLAWLTGAEVDPVELRADATLAATVWQLIIDKSKTVAIEDMLEHAVASEV